MFHRGWPGKQNVVYTYGDTRMKFEDIVFSEIADIKGQMLCESTCTTHLN